LPPPRPSSVTSSPATGTAPELQLPAVFQSLGPLFGVVAARVSVWVLAAPPLVAELVT
jgi:hypothetical protein